MQRGIQSLIYDIRNILRMHLLNMVRQLEQDALLLYPTDKKPCGALVRQVDGHYTCLASQSSDLLLRFRTVRP